jgi:surface antigen
MVRNAAFPALAALGFLVACSDAVRIPTAAEPGGAARYTAPSEPVNGEFIRTSTNYTTYLVYGRTLYGIPDPQTLRACTGGRENVVRIVDALPAWPQRTLPSAGDPTSQSNRRNWMFGDRPIQSSSGGAATALVGCVKSGIPTPTEYQALYGDQDWSRIVSVQATEFDAFPTGPIAPAVPLRRAGTLLQSGSAPVQWITYLGGSLGVPSPTTMDSYCRGWAEMGSNASEYAAYTQQGVIQDGPGTSPKCLRGDDYPDKSWTMDVADQWSFAARNCTSFAAWRLNQDGIAFTNQYGGVTWSHARYWASVAAGLTPSTSRPRTWVDHVAERGAIAQWNAASWNNYYGHVAYVAGILTSGNIVLEEYNFTVGGGYDYREVSPSTVDNFIHFH